MGIVCDAPRIMNRRTFATTLVGSTAALVAGLETSARAAGSKFLVYYGPYTNAKSGSKGIYVSTFDAATGALGEPVLAAETTNPSFLEIHPSKKYLYAVGEMSDGNPEPGWGRRRRCVGLRLRWGRVVQRVFLRHLRQRRLKQSANPVGFFH